MYDVSINHNRSIRVKIPQDHYESSTSIDDFQQGFFFLNSSTSCCSWVRKDLANETTAEHDFSWVGSLSLRWKTGVSNKKACWA